MAGVAARPAGADANGIDPACRGAPASHAAASADAVERQLEPPCATAGAAKPAAQGFGEAADRGGDRRRFAKRLGKVRTDPPG